MISIAYQTEFCGCKRIVSIFGNVGGTACIIVRDTVTMGVVKEVSGVGIEDALQLYVKLLDMYATKCKNCSKSC